MLNNYSDLVSSQFSSKKLNLNEGNDFQKKRSLALSLGLMAAPIMLSTLSVTSMAAGYNVTEIPVPSEITVPSGDTARPVCLSINEAGQVACYVDIIENLVPTPLDRFSPRPKVFASYAYRWDSVTKQLTLLSSLDPNQLDKTYVINNSGLVGGSTDNAKTKKPQGTIWSGTGSSLFGPGEITDMNNLGDYVLANRLFINNTAVSFPGSQLQVQAINNPIGTNPVTSAGTQSFSSRLGQSGTGILFSKRPPATKPGSWFADPTIVSGVSVKDITDNGNFVISGIPQTIGGLVAFNCTAILNCQLYFPTVTGSGRTIPWITLNAVDNARHAVGTDGGFALLINPPTGTAANGTRVDLNSLLPPTSFSTLGWFLNEATDINNSGKIVGMGIKGGKRVAFLLTPIP